MSILIDHGLNFNTINCGCLDRGVWALPWPHRRAVLGGIGRRVEYFVVGPVRRKFALIRLPVPARCPPPLPCGSPSRMCCARSSVMLSRLMPGFRPLPSPPPPLIIAAPDMPRAGAAPTPATEGAVVTAGDVAMTGTRTPSGVCRYCTPLGSGTEVGGIRGPICPRPCLLQARPALRSFARLTCATNSSLIDIRHRRRASPNQRQAPRQASRAPKQ